MWEEEEEDECREESRLDEDEDVDKLLRPLVRLSRDGAGL